MAIEFISKWNELIFYSQKLFFIWQFETVAFLFVLYLQSKTEQECQDTKRSKDNHGHYIAVGRNAERTNQHGDQAQTDILYPENQAISRTQNLLIDNLWHTGPHGRWHQREAYAQHQNSAKRQGFAWIKWQDKSEDTMTNNHDNRTYHHHGCTFTLIINKHSEEWSQDHRQDWEPFEQARCLSVANHQCFLEEVGRKALEWENRRIVQYAQESDNPEHLARENLT